MPVDIAIHLVRADEADGAWGLDMCLENRIRPSGG